MREDGVAHRGSYLKPMHVFRAAISWHNNSIRCRPMGSSDPRLQIPLMRSTPNSSVNPSWPAAFSAPPSALPLPTSPLRLHTSPAHSPSHSPQKPSALSPEPRILNITSATPPPDPQYHPSVITPPPPPVLPPHRLHQPPSLPLPPPYLLRPPHPPHPPIHPSPQSSLPSSTSQLRLPTTSAQMVRGRITPIVWVTHGVMRRLDLSIMSTLLNQDSEDACCAVVWCGVVWCAWGFDLAEGEGGMGWEGIQVGGWR